jgi:hypothetical protein
MPFAPAARKPFFFIMKLDPMKKAELHASARPLAWSDENTTASELLGSSGTRSRIPPLLQKNDDFRKAPLG